MPADISNHPNNSNDYGAQPCQQQSKHNVPVKQKKCTPACCREAASAALDPLAKSVTIRLCKHGVAVNQRVIGWRHIAAAHHLADSIKPVLLLLIGVSRPFGEVHFVAA